MCSLSFDICINYKLSLRQEQTIKLYNAISGPAELVNKKEPTKIILSLHVKYIKKQKSTETAENCAPETNKTGKYCQLQSVHLQVVKKVLSLIQAAMTFELSDRIIRQIRNLFWHIRH